MTDKRRVYSYVKVLVQKPAARGQVLRRGSNALDILSQSLSSHEEVSNLTFWSQPGLKVYTPSPDFHAAHSLLTGQDPFYPVPDTSASPFPTVHWTQTQGSVTAMTCLPDGTPAVHELKIMDSDEDGAAKGSPWAFQTSDLGAWRVDAGAKTPGSFGTDRGVAVTVRLGTSDGPDGTQTTDEPAVQPGQTASDGSSPGDLRVTVGNIWSVLFRGGVPLAFEKKFRYKDKAGRTHDWVRLHEFSGGAPSLMRGGLPEYLVTFCIVAGTLLVGVSGHSVAQEAYAYQEPDPRQAGQFKRLSLASAPVRVTGRAGGGPRWIGLRRIGWRVGDFYRTLSLGAVAPKDLVLEAFGYQNPIGDAGLGATFVRLGPTTIRYHAQVRGTTDGRTTAALKWVWAHSDSLTQEGTSDYTDYGGAVKTFTEEMCEPDFSGAGGTRGSDGAVELFFDMQALALINPAWRADLAPYVPVTFVLGQVRASGDGTGEEEVETTRLTGYFWTNRDEVLGFNDGIVMRDIRDAFVRLKEPGPLVDTSYAPLSLAVTPVPDGQIYGWQGIAYYLRKAMGDAQSTGLKVYLPSDWYSLAFAVTSTDVTGNLPAEDVPLFNPPYGKYVAEALKEVATLDFAALYRAGDVWVYGHFDRIVKGQPVHDVYDGRGANGLPSNAEPPDAQAAWTASGAEIVEDSAVDFNRWVAWADVPGGAGTNAPVNLGAPLLTADVRDNDSIASSWERTKLFQGGQFVQPGQIERFIRTVQTLSAGHKAARKIRLTFPWLLPEVYWGHKMKLHGFVDIVDSQGAPVNGRTFRVYKMKHTGTLPKTGAVVTLIEVLAGEE